MAKNIVLDLSFIDGNVDIQNAVIGVALSGGRDSVALAHALKMAGYTVVAINVEHGIRGQESVADSEFVARFCRAQNIPLLSFCVDAPAFSKAQGYTLEQGARILRYEVFERVLNENKCDYVALAHHLDDQVETVFMRILRGTGLNGLVGMKKQNGKYIRPLLEYTRDDIDAYIKSNGLEYVDDSTNFDVTYTRNFLRKEISVLKERFPSLCESVSRLCKNAQEDNDFINSLVPNVLKENDDTCIYTSDLTNKVIGKRLILRACNTLNVFQDIEDRHFDMVLGLANAENGKSVNLPHGIVATKAYDKIAFCKRGQNDVDDGFEISIGELLRVGVKAGVGVSIVGKNEFENRSTHETVPQRTLYVDLDKLPSDCILRHRANGDYIEKFGGGSKSVGDFLTDIKFPKNKRDSLLVIASGKEVFAICGVEISKKVRVSDSTTNIAKIFIEK